MADANNKVDLQLNIKTDYQAAGMDAATEATLKQAEAQKAAAEAAKAQAEAAKAEAQAAAAVEAAAARQAAEERRLAAEQEAAAAAAEREKAEQEAVEAAMRLTSMTVKQLEAEMRQLTAARKAAASAGDTEAYKQLTAQMAQVKQATEQARNAANLNRAAWAGQIQAAASLGGTIDSLTGQFKDLSKNLKEGSVDFGGMTASAMQLFGAFKSGMGPLALAMYTLGQLQSVYKQWSGYFSDSKQSSASWQKKLEEDAAALKAAQEALSAAEARYRKAQADAFKAEGESRAEKLEQEARKEAQNAADRFAAEEEASRHRMALWQAEMAAATDADKERLQRNIDAERKASEQRAADRAEAEAKAAEKYAADLEQAFSGGKYAELLKIKLPSLDELTDVKAKLDGVDFELREDLEGQEQALKQRQREIEKQMGSILAQVKAVDPAFRGTREQAVEWLAGLQATATEQQKAVTAAQDNAAAARRTADAAKQQAANKLEEMAAEKRAAQAAKAAADAQEARAKELRRFFDDTKTTGNYVPQETRTQREILEEDAKLLRERERQLIAMQQRGGLTEAQEKEVADALAEVRRQTQGLADAQRANAAAARQWLNELAVPNIKAQNRMAQSNADRYAKLWKRLADQAQRAAENGNDKQLDSIKKRLTQTAAAWGNVTRQSDKTDKLLRDTLDAVDSVRGSDKRTAAAKKRTAAAAEKAADQAADAANTARDAKPETVANKAAAAAAQLQTQTAAVQQALDNFAQQQGGVLEALNNLATAVQKLSGQVAEALQGAANAADAAAATGKAAAAANRRLSANLNRAWGAIRDLQNGL